MTTTTVDTQAIVAGSGGMSTPVKLTLQEGTTAVSAQISVTTTRAAAPGILVNGGRNFTLFWAFSPDDLTLANVPTLLRHCAKSQKMTLNPDIEQAGQKQQIRDKPNGQYMYLWFEYPSSVDAYSVVIKTTELFFSNSGGQPVVVGATANAAGNSTITPTGHNQLQIVTVTGVARTSVFILDVAGRVNGDILELRFVQPATAAIVQEIRNATAGGTLIYTYTTDGSATDIPYYRLYFNGTAWKALMDVVPVV